MTESYGDTVQDLRRQIGAEPEAAEDDSARAAWHARWDQQDYRRSLYTTAEADHPALNPSGQPCDCEAGGTGWERSGVAMTVRWPRAVAAEREREAG
jgi:hypothetical protein